MEFEGKPLSLFLLVDCGFQVGFTGTAGLVGYPPVLWFAQAVFSKLGGGWGSSVGDYSTYSTSDKFFCLYRLTANNELRYIDYGQESTR